MSAQRLFLERENYRKRRLMDLVRLMPLFGLVLLMLPLFWGREAEAEGAVTSADALLYLFAVWAFLVLSGLMLWWWTRGYADRDLMRADEDETG